jgi:hypothetical protein
MIPVGVFLLSLLIFVTIPMIVLAYAVGWVVRLCLAFSHRNLRPMRGEVWMERGEKIVILSGWPYVVFRTEHDLVTERSEEWAYRQLHRGRYRAAAAGTIPEEALRQLYDHP